MTTIKLVGSDVLGNPVKLGKDVVTFLSETGDIEISDITEKTIKLTTVKGTYVLKKHITMNYYHGVCKERKVQVSLKKVVGTVRYW